MRRHPLTMQDIYENLRENFDDVITYQGTRKAVLALISERIVEHNETGYTISPVWVDGLTEFSKELDGAIRWNSEPVTTMNEGETRIYKFKGKMIEPYEWFLEQALKISETSKIKGNLTMYFNGMWAVTVVGQREMRIIKKLMKAFHPVVISGQDTKYDRELRDFFLTNFGGTCQLGVNLGTEEILVFGGFVFRKIETPKVTRLLDDMLQVGTLSELALLYQVFFSRNSKLTWVVTKDRKVARETEQQLVSAAAKKAKTLR